MFKKVLIAAVAVAGAATAAQASDFNGPFIGGGATLDNVNGSGEFEGIGADGVGGTAFLGYDLPLGRAFVGAEANIDLNTADAQGFEAKWGWGVSARAGYRIQDTTGIYGRIGYQRSKVGAEGFGSAWGDGIRFGGGVETGITDSTSLRFELNHVNYESDLKNNQAVVGVVFGF
ncbi:hypothetical protein CLG96_06315 [Sphingomonas oleivorans]|uniref:Outer membrane protein beta-barrel domain-containing protein n=1 Tax=Sphingomonas oleivorans TaxID=1735121 RepID=A0A2T5FZN5_9SPHN|nr:outer membrane beta-barrel protein [Sphingomonas oleivorans]PTQ12166.1 hypothetical protein CLG96_06315 [Sphingomonas oleivorans]